MNNKQFILFAQQSLREKEAAVHEVKSSARPRVEDAILFLDRERPNIEAAIDVLRDALVKLNPES